uniref:Protein phosphatase 2c n=1 Tax=Rhizophora mucronata TaxID=61149 RepID=A0A2P2LMX1_RHIMU
MIFTSISMRNIKQIMKIHSCNNQQDIIRKLPKDLKFVKRKLMIPNSSISKDLTANLHSSIILICEFKS